MWLPPFGLILLPALLGLVSSCISSGDQSTINSAFSAGGAGTVVQLCQNTVISITDSIQFTADNQELSTEGYPTGNPRATIKIAAGNSVATLISGAWHNGIRILNIQVDGDRPNTGYQVNGGANIEIGGGSTGQTVSYVSSRNPRGWSCLHIIGSGNTALPCQNSSITNNDIGPCGQEGTDSAGHGLWADGISLDCTNSLVSGNTIKGSTDGGIVIFGSPGSSIQDNIITSSETDRGFGAINMVDNSYGGSYAGVSVTGNTITGLKLFNLGIGIGANIWSFDDPNPLTGPATISGNIFTGHVAFPIALNGWGNGITISGNDVSQVTSPRSGFADASSCVPAIQTLFNNNNALVYYPPGVTGSTNLQSDFVAAAGNITNFLCTTPPLPTTVEYGLGQLSIVSDSPPFARLPGVVMQYQGDSNVVVYDTTNPTGWKPLWASGHTVSSCGNPSTCHMVFQGDGNLVTYYNNTPKWSTGTAGRGAEMLCLNGAPWIQILDAGGNVIWDTTMST